MNSTRWHYALFGQERMVSDHNVTLSESFYSVYKLEYFIEAGCVPKPGHSCRGLLQSVKQPIERENKSHILRTWQ